MSTVSPETGRVAVGAEDPAAPRGMPRALAIAVMAGSALVFYALTTHGSFSPLYQQVQPGFADQFFPAQALALVHGHLYVRPDQLPSECFLYHGRCYGYFGLTPSLLRLPLLPFLDGAKRSFTPVYMTAALTLAVGSALGIASRILAQVRRTPLLSFLGVALGLSLGPACVLVMLARPAVYEEAIAWSVAFALLGIYSYLRWWAADGRGWAILLVVSLMLSTGARPTTLPLGVLLGAGIVARALLRRRDAGLDPRALLFASMVAVLPIAACLGAYWLKFHTLVPSILLNQQIGGPAAAPTWLAIRRLNHDQMSGVRFIPTALLAYLRPDGVAFAPGFPLVHFRFGLTQPVRYLGVPPGSIYIEPFSTLADDMPLVGFTVIAAVVYTLRQARQAGAGLRTSVRRGLGSPLTYTIAGTAASACVMLSSGFLTNRYVGDLFPLVAVALAVAARVLAPAITRLSGRRALALAIAVTFILAWTLLVDLGLEYQSWWHTVV